MYIDYNAISPYVRFATRSLLPAPYQIGQRIIFDYELLYVDGGTFYLQYDGKDYVGKKNDIFLFCPGHPHTMRDINGISLNQPHVHFDVTYDQFSKKIYTSFKDYPAFTPEERTWIRKDIFKDSPIGPRIKMENLGAFKKCLYDLIALYDNPPQFATLLMKEKMIELLHMVFKSNLSQQDSSDDLDRVTGIKLAHMIRQYIDYNCKNQISLETLEKQFNYSKYYISKTFTLYTGTSVIHYYNDKRMVAAKRMLVEGQNVTEVVKALNFNSIYSFSRFFKSKEGCSPTDYVKKYIATEAASRYFIVK